MVEIAFDTFVHYSFPSLASNIVEACEALDVAQDPPFSHGNYFIEIRRSFLTQSWIHKVFYNDMCEPLFAMAVRLNYLYIDTNFAMFSTRRINDTFRTF